MSAREASLFRRARALKRLAKLYVAPDVNWKLKAI